MKLETQYSELCKRQHHINQFKRLHCTRSAVKQIKITNIKIVMSNRGNYKTFSVFFGKNWFVSK